ncbi:hypothetical protein Syun_020906 [Stephania yunnanensis]|uniref:Uncharacterized protein n=1 Tax=Stephania yunnanensis TaxID=152371 RepID=A0AAP0IEQ2_9MAGN
MPPPSNLSTMCASSVRLLNRVCLIHPPSPPCESQVVKPYFQWDLSIDEAIVRATYDAKVCVRYGVLIHELHALGALDKDEDDEVTPNDIFLHVHTKDHDSTDFGVKLVRRQPIVNVNGLWCEHLSGTTTATTSRASSAVGMDLAYSPQQQHDDNDRDNPDWADEEHLGDEKSITASLSEKNIVEDKHGEGHDEKVKHKKDKSSKEEKKSKKSKDGDNDVELVDAEEEKSKDKKKRTKEKNLEDKNDARKLKVKLEKIDAKMQDLVAKREEILKLIKEAEAQHQSAGDNTTNVGEG